MADIITGSTQLDVTKQSLISSLVQKELAAAAVFVQTITDVSMFASKGMKAISFPKLGSFTVTNRASGTTNDAQALTATLDTLLLDQPAFVKWIIDSNDAFQSNISVLEEYIKRASSAHARYVDGKIVTLLESIAFNTPAQADATPVTDAAIRNLRQQLIVKNADRNNLFMAIAPDQENAILGIDKFVRYDSLGFSNVPTGAIGKIYGMNTFVSNALEAGQVLIYEKGAAAVGFQMGANYGEMPAIDYGSSAKKCVVDQLFGLKGLQLGVEGVAGTASPLCVKLTTL